MTRPTFLSLFSGIGGLDLGLERAGWTCIGQVENDPYCNRVLAKHWPDVPRWGDIKELNPDDLPRADLIVGGFPCQPVSLAGRRQGQNDERWLWPEFHRIVRALRPRWVLLENVPGLLVRGMGDVLGDLATGGYDAEWDCIPAAAVGAPHLRYRVFIVAYPDSGSGPGRRQPRSLEGHGAESARVPVADPERQQLRNEPGRRDGQGRPRQAVVGDDGEARPLADAAGTRREARPPGAGGPARDGTRRPGPGRLGGEMADAPGDRRTPQGERTTTGHLDWGDQLRREPSTHWLVEPDVGRVADGVPARLDRLRGLGNAVVPQVAELLGRRILKADAA